MSAMLKTRWQEIDKKFIALSLRERAMVAIAALAFVAYVGNALWVTPIFSRSQQLAKLTVQQEKELLALQTQLEALQVQVAIDPNAPFRQQQGEIRRQMGELDQRMKRYEAAMVPPEQMGPLLSNLLRQAKGVQLLSLKTLPVDAILKAKTNEAGLPVPPKVNMYKHGYELKLEGSYLELTNYLVELEAQPQQLLWQRAVMAVGEYPKATLTLTFYSLSLDKDWLSL